MMILSGKSKDIWSEIRMFILVLSKTAPEMIE